MIDQIALLKQRLDLIQRRLLPFAWIAGTPSTGLTGHGTIAVQDVLGCIVTVTTIPVKWGHTWESPARYIPSLGVIRGVKTPNGDEAHWIHYKDEIVLLNDPWATTIHYDFGAGVIATITPILPEP